MPEAADQYIGGEILLARGDQMARSIAAQNCNANKNIMGRAHANPVLNTRMYQVEFNKGKVTILMNNIIGAWMYAQCDADVSEYLHLDLLDDYHNENKKISLTDQQTSIWGRSVTQQNILMERWFHLIGEVV